MKSLCAVCFLWILPWISQAREYTTIVIENERGGPTGDSVVTGVITPLDQEMKNFYLRNADGVIEVKLTPDALVGLQVRPPQHGQLEKRKISFKAGEQKYEFELPEKLWVKRTFKDGETVERFLKSGSKKLELGKIYTNEQPDHLPTATEPWIAGRITKVTDLFMTVSVKGEDYEIRTDSHDRMQRVMGLFTHRDIQPFAHQAFAYGKMKDHVFHAHEVTLRMLEDGAKKENPNLGRYLFIGDSISGNYDRALRTALKGKLNIFHPPVNCGPSARGVEQIHLWLGAYDQPGQQWDVISFNFGHWDAGIPKDLYQKNLETIIAELQKTKAKLIWVTTAPVPHGYAGPAKLTKEGRAPGRQHGVMKSFLNPWALEVMKRHPEITICDQHGLISGEKFYATWLAKAGTKEGSHNRKYGDVHIGGLLGEPVGRQLARTVLDILGREDEPLGPYDLDLGWIKAQAKHPALNNLDVDDLVNLLNNDTRLRKY